jgi:hypothetical protein
MNMGLLKIAIGLTILTLADTPSLIFGQEVLAMPKNESARVAVAEASEWLLRHVKTGSLTTDNTEKSISVIAWKDPTLNPELPEQLAGYVITDTLWASYALTLTHPKVAEELRDSLERLNCSGNSLHEVVWQPLEVIAHKPADLDIVHGRSIGVMSSGKITIDVRSFTMNTDRDFEIGHPSLFAEHSVYQALYEFRLGKKDSAKKRLRAIFRTSNEDTKPQIHWERTNGLLVDYVVEKEFNSLLAGKTKTCRQYSFKLAILLYACRLLGLEREFPEELEEMNQRLQSAQLRNGGVAHYFDVENSSSEAQACPDATGEATAIFILAQTVLPRPE